MILLLFILCLLLLPLRLGFVIGPRFVIQHVVFFLVLQSSHWGRELVALFYCILGSCGCYCSLSLPGVNLSACPVLRHPTESSITITEINLRYFSTSPLLRIQGPENKTVSGIVSEVYMLVYVCAHIFSGIFSAVYLLVYVCA